MVVQDNAVFFNTNIPINNALKSSVNYLCANPQFFWVPFDSLLLALWRAQILPARTKNKIVT
jgi:hypothetical protein